MWVRCNGTFFHWSTRLAALLQDSETAVQWWLISVCDPAASTSGPAELAGVGKETDWAKDRNLRVG